MADKEYIDRNALIAEYDRIHIGPAGGARKLMVDAPAADVVEVERGSWLPQMLMGGETVCCSECKTIGSPSWNWCPNCGADMRGERDDGSGSEKG